MLTLTPLPFAEHYVTVREYDRACLLYLYGRPQRIVGRSHIHPLRSVGPWKASDFEAVPVVIVAEKPQKAE